ncbi:hypothetical protein [Novosphingobium sp. BL-52-GroH]|uniref:hypothetical protein n=1 Tax=Novosphingobium sp. BL-52-GroH TaxID=3349877 RepID=UPI00384F2F3C
MAQRIETAPCTQCHDPGDVLMLNEQYGARDYQTMSWSFQHSDEPREGMRAFMEKRPPAWLPEGFGPDRAPVRVPQ